MNAERPALRIVTLDDPPARQPTGLYGGEITQRPQPATVQCGQLFTGDAF
jgi:hypothetical protein